MERIDTDRHRSTRPWNRPSNHQNRDSLRLSFFFVGVYSPIRQSRSIGRPRAIHCLHQQQGPKAIERTQSLSGRKENSSSSRIKPQPLSLWERNKKFLQAIEFGFWWELFPRESKEMETIPIKKPLNCLFCSLNQTNGNNNHVIETIKSGDENYIENTANSSKTL